MKGYVSNFIENLSSVNENLVKLVGNTCTFFKRFYASSTMLTMLLLPMQLFMHVLSDRRLLLITIPLLLLKLIKCIQVVAYTNLRASSFHSLRFLVPIIKLFLFPSESHCKKDKYLQEDKIIFFNFNKFGLFPEQNMSNCCNSLTMPSETIILY